MAKKLVAPKAAKAKVKNNGDNVTFTRQFERLQVHIDITNITGGFSVPFDRYVVSSARVVSDKDPFASDLVKTVAALVPLVMVAEEEAYHLVQWPDGLMAIVKSNLPKEDYEKALVRAYQNAFVQVVHGMEASYLYDEAAGR